MIPVPFKQTVYRIAGVEFIAGSYPGQVHVSTLKGYFNISKVTVLIDNPVRGFSRLKVWAVGGKQDLHLSLEDDEARKLENWLKSNQVVVEFECLIQTPMGPATFAIPKDRPYTPAGVVDVDEDAVPEVYAKQAECPECYGTGFHKGFGAPCSKGCKVK